MSWIGQSTPNHMPLLARTASPASDTNDQEKKCRPEFWLAILSASLARINAFSGNSGWRMKLNCGTRLRSFAADSPTDTPPDLCQKSKLYCLKHQLCH